MNPTIYSEKKKKHKHLLRLTPSYYTMIACHYAHSHELFLYKHVALQYTGLTCGGIIYPYIDALKSSSGIIITYLTAEDSCCATLRVTVEKYCTRFRRQASINPTSVIW